MKDYELKKLIGRKVLCIKSKIFYDTERISKGSYYEVDNISNGQIVVLKNNYGFHGSYNTDHFDIEREFRNIKLDQLI